MSKNKPTKRIPFEGGYVELQYLSKGVLSHIQSQLAALHKDLEKISKEDLQNSDEIPEGLDLNLILDKINKVNYYKLSKAIKAWSEPEEITEETVLELDDEIFDKINEEIDNMNELSVDEKKN
jgi:hypothetical protein